jgi:transcriptional regulator with XRE-family HTH domain
MKKKPLELEVAPDTTKVEIGEFLKAARKSVDRVQTEVAERMDIAQNAVARLESGHVQPTLQTMARFAQALGLRCVIRFEA